MTIFEVPLSPKPQRFRITLGGNDYQLVLRWCPPAAAWVLDILDTASAAILRGIMLVTGTDLLEQFAYLNFGGKLYAQSDHAPFAPPTFENLGIVGHVYFVVP